MKRQTFLICLLASLAVLAPRARLGAISVTNAENLGVIGKTGELAVESFQLAQTPQQDSDLLSQIAVALVKVGQIDTPAESLRDRALAVAGSILIDEAKARALTDIASAFAQSGDKERAVAVARSIPSDGNNPMALSVIASALAQAGEIDRALEVARSIADDRSKAWAFSGIGSALAQAGEEERGLQVAGSIADDRHKAWALIGIVNTLIEKGQTEKAAEILERAIATVGL